MGKTRDELVELVQSRIDDLSPNEQTALVSPTTIELELDEAAKFILRNAKKQLVYAAGIAISSSQFCLVSFRNNIPHSVIIPVTNNFIRFLRMRLNVWQKPTDDMVSTDMNVYKQQFNRFQTAKAITPVCAFIPFQFSYTNPVNSQVIETITALEGFPAPAHVNNPLYRTMPSGDLETNIANSATAKGMTAVFNSSLTGEQKSLLNELLICNNLSAEQMPDGLVDPMVWKAAENCLMSSHQYDLAKGARSNYVSVLTEIKIGMKGEESAQKKAEAN